MKRLRRHETFETHILKTPQGKEVPKTFCGTEATRMNSANTFLTPSLIVKKSFLPKVISYKDSDVIVLYIPKSLIVAYSSSP